MLGFFCSPFLCFGSSVVCLFQQLQSVAVGLRGLSSSFELFVDAVVPLCVTYG